MLYLKMSRAALLTHLPPGGEAVEIGVAEGEFSRAILDAAKPRRLHLIDPWEHQAQADYEDDPNNASADEQERRFQAVSQAFAAETAAGRVVIHRAYSGAVADTFADGQLDWVYIDGLHTRAGAAADLAAYAPKIRPGGFILGHDYTNNFVAQQLQFGVIEAVNAFVLDAGWDFVALTSELWPTYLLARDATAPATVDLMRTLIGAADHVVELRDYPRRHGEFLHRAVPLEGRSMRLIGSF